MTGALCSLYTLANSPLSSCPFVTFANLAPLDLYSSLKQAAHHIIGMGAAELPLALAEKLTVPVLANAICTHRDGMARYSDRPWGISPSDFAAIGRAVLPFIFHGASPGETAYYLFCCRRDIVPAQLFSGVAAAAELAVDVDLPESTFTQLGPRGAWMYMWGLAFRSVHHDTHFGMFWASSQVGPRNLLEPIEGQRVHPSGEREFLLGVNRFILYATFFGLSDFLPLILF
jgi:hypothetical protein